MSHRLPRIVAALALAAGLLAVATGRAQELSCNFIDLETFAEGDPLGTVAGQPAVTFDPSWLAAVDADDGGSAPVANEPSPSTVTQLPQTAVINFDAPVQLVELQYSARPEVLPLAMEAWDGLGGSGSMVASVDLTTVGWAPGGAPCSGDPGGGYCLFDLGQISLASDSIRSLTLTSATPGIFGAFFDDFHACTESAAAGGVTFTDVTAQAGVEFRHGFLEGDEGLMPKMIAGGVAAGDYDGDGLVDLYAVFGNRGPTRLFHNLGNGVFEEVAADAGVQIDTGLGREVGPTFADVDGDGDLDLLIGGILYTEPRLFLNDGDGTFTESTDTAGLVTGRENSFSAAFADYDGDDDLDLFLGHWTMSDDCAAGACDAHLWRNDGDGVFTAVDIYGDVAGFDVEDFTFAPNWADIDNDGDLDLVIASDFFTSRVILNDGDGTFTEVTDPAVITDENGMGATVADFDNDGNLDWFVTSIYNDLTGKTGNRFYRGQGDGTFLDETDATGTREGFWGWGACAADFDNDGHLDIFHVNGWPAGGNSDSDFDVDPARLFMADGAGGFVESSAAMGLSESTQGRGVVCFDMDRDGDVDLYSANNNGDTALWRNDGGNENAYLNVTLRQAGGNPLGVGGRLYATAGGTTQMRELRAGSNFESQDPLEAHFGLADATEVDELAVVWPDGTVSTHAAVAADRFVEAEALYRDPSTQSYGGVQAFSFAGCDVCQVEASMEVAGDGGGSPRALLAGWIFNGQTNVLALLDPDADQLSFLQRVGGAILQRVDVPTTIDEGVVYDVKMAFDGTDFRVWLDGLMVVETPNAAANTPTGIAGVATLNATATVHNVAVTTLTDR